MANRIIGVLALLLGCATGAQGAISMVTVGNAGNAADANGYGSVSYNYQIGQYEITAAQYTAFLNAVATSSDSYGLYNSLMNSTYGCRIVQAGFIGSRTYSVDSEWADRAVNNVSLYDAARYSNWLTTTNGGTDPANGDTESGVYTFINGALTSIMDHELAAMTFGTAYFLPTEDEWYKAAYHDASAGKSGTYYLYPTKSNDTPSNDLTDPDSGNSATFQVGTSDFTDGTHQRTIAGAHADSESAYVTFDQGGNVLEWTEESVLRGGSYWNDASYMASSYRFTSNSNCEANNYGFRVASLSDPNVSEVPEPASAIIWLFGVGGLFAHRRRKQLLRN